jgi:16S rRNA (cytosine1402-N4)-methyltransferase
MRNRNSNFCTDIPREPNTSPSPCNEIELSEPQPCTLTESDFETVLSVSPDDPVTFKIGRAYRHSSGGELFIVGKAETTLWGNCLIAEEAGPLNFVLADLGVSSMQIDNPDRGFSFKIDGPLDLRLNPNSGKSAAALLKNISRDRLAELFYEYSDEPYAEEIATAIIETAKRGVEIKTTTDLKEVIKESLSFLAPANRAEEIKKTCQRCFQALRIEVNNEFGVLEKFLEKLPDALASGGKVAILSFHSGEDRRVKKIFKAMYRAGIYSEIAPDPIKASAEEINSNPRARSAKLRWAIKA